MRSCELPDVNIQLVTSKKIPSNKISVSKLGEDVVALIQSAESELQSGLEEMYANMNEETFRAMRRTLPITKTKMEWNMNSLRMNRMVTMPTGMKPTAFALPGMVKK